MKYSVSNEPLVCMMTTSSCYQGTSKMTVKGILWHSTGANNPNLKRYVQPSDDDPKREELLKLIGVNKYGNDWNHIKHSAGVNAWIGKLADGTITTVQTLPWDYRPWGCGSSSKGSCNSGWIQFEIQEDGLSDASYFNTVYEEACELTAYLCELFKIDPEGTVNLNGVTVPTILCHADAHDLGLGSNHSDVYHWFNKYNKSMDDVRNDVAKLMEQATPAITVTPTPTPTTTTKELYRVRKAWVDVASQIGAYNSLENAKKACDSTNGNYFVFNSAGEAIYPEVVASNFKKLDRVKLITGSTYATGKSIPSWVFKEVLYVRDIYANGNIVISTKPVGAITGVVKPTSLIAYNEAQPDFQTYIVRVTADVLNVREGAGTKYKVNTQVRKNDLYTIVDEKDGWGRLKSGAGWISLKYTKKVK